MGKDIPETRHKFPILIPNQQCVLILTPSLKFTIYYHLNFQKLGGCLSIFLLFDEFQPDSLFSLFACKKTCNVKKETQTTKRVAVFEKDNKNDS